jgi:thymidylate synthase ThyX
MLAEFNTHRMFSRNSASSRAIPFNKIVKMVQENPFIPIAWQKNHKGMQGTEYFTKDTMIGNENKPIKISKKRSLHYSAGNKFKPLLQAWHLAKKEAIEKATQLHNMGVTKQLCNRLLEPFMWHTVIVTSGKEGLDNFYKLRCPAYTHVSDKLDGTSVTVFKSKKDYEHCYGKQGFSALEWLKINTSQADIHIQAIAELMWDAMNESAPKELKAGEWHIPFGGNIDMSHSSFDKFKFKDRALTDKELMDLKVQVSVARCARISYTTLGDNPKVDYKADIRLHDMLVKSGHWSPFEHIARAMTHQEYYQFRNGWLDNTSEEVISQSAGWCRNFRGFIQYRTLIDN